MFKIFKLGIKAVCLVGKLFPQTLLVSIASEALLLSSKALIRYIEKKGSTKTVKALEKIGDSVIVMSTALANHKEHEFTQNLLEDLKKKTKVKSRDQLIKDYHNESDFLGY